MKRILVPVDAVHLGSLIALEQLKNHVRRRLEAPCLVMVREICICLSSVRKQRLRGTDKKLTSIARQINIVS